MGECKIVRGHRYEIEPAAQGQWYVFRGPNSERLQNLERVGPFCTHEEAVRYRDLWIEVTSRVRRGRRKPPTG